MSALISDFISFLNSSPTLWHAARQIADRLAQADFIPLDENDRWVLEMGKSYFVIRDGAAVCAFRLPKGSPKKAVILASHLDSPGLKLKPIAEISHPRLTQFSTEVYGGPLLHTWFDRDLALAGRVAIEGETGQIETSLVFLDDYPLSIPSLPIHLDRSIVENGLRINAQNHLNPIASIAHSKNHPATVELLLRKHLSFKKLLAFDLFLVPLEKASFIGAEGDLISAARLDNLSSAYACLQGLASSQPSSQILQLAVFWNHEEIGSKSFSGAESFFLNQVMDRICLHQKIDREDYYRMKNRSYCLSVDVAHGYNPNYSDKYDPHNCSYLGDGVVLKTNAKYATNAATAAPIIELCEEKGWPLQKTASRSDIPSGSTVGSIMAAIGDFPTVDIGIASWAMHSIRETIAISDEIALCHLLKAVLEKTG